MKIVILDGTLDTTPNSFPKYMGSLKKELADRGHAIDHFALKDADLSHCIGCFDCWVKTPGQCVFDDRSREINASIMQADFVLFATPLTMGFASYQLKRKMDRMIPLVLPYIEIDQGELHHVGRYQRYPTFGLLMQPGADDSAEDAEITAQIFARTTLNIKSRLAFAATMDEVPADLAARIEHLDGQSYPFNRDIPLKTRVSVSTVKELTIFNGSPRGRQGNTPILLEKFAEGFQSQPDQYTRTYHLFRTKDKTAFTDAFKGAECVLIGFPLYTDGMPGVVKEFIDALAPFTRRDKNPPIAFLVQSGFMENHHSRYVQRYLEGLAARLHSPYLGTLVRGGCEGVRLQPEQANRKTFAALKNLGAQLAAQGGFDDADVQVFGNMERLPRWSLPVLNVFEKMPVLHRYWDVQLEQNQAFAGRFAHPYGD